VVLLWFAVGGCLGPTPKKPISKKKKRKKKEKRSSFAHNLLDAPAPSRRASE
jgi:hypothetical protein